eukprot:279617-Pleurochrysis_carterae.AAC.1
MQHRSEGSMRMHVQSTIMSSSCDAPAMRLRLGSLNADDATRISWSKFLKRGDSICDMSAQQT